MPPPSNFDSFDESGLGGFHESGVAARGVSEKLLAQGIKFIGKTQYSPLSNTGSFSNVANTKKGTFSIWFNYDDLVTETGDLYLYNSVNVSVKVSFFTSSNLLRVVVAGIYGTINSSLVSISDGWHNFLFSFDNTGSETTYIYFDNSKIYESLNTLPFDTVFIGNSTELMPNKEGLMYDDYFVFTGQYMDISIASNRLKFISDSSEPSDLGVDGSIPFGIPPQLYLTGSLSNYFTNKGTGGEPSINYGLFQDMGTLVIGFRGFSTYSDPDSDNSIIYNCAGVSSLPTPHGSVSFQIAGGRFTVDSLYTNGKFVADLTQEEIHFDNANECLDPFYYNKVGDDWTNIKISSASLTPDEWGAAFDPAVITHNFTQGEKVTFYPDNQNIL